VYHLQYVTNDLFYVVTRPRVRCLPVTEVKHLALLVTASGAQTNWVSSVLLRNPLRDPGPAITLRDPDPGHQPCGIRTPAITPGGSGSRPSARHLQSPAFSSLIRDSSLWATTHLSESRLISLSHDSSL